MKRIFILVIIALLTTMNLVSIFSENTESAEIHHIENAGGPVTEYTFVIGDGGGSDLNLGKISIRKGVTVADAYFNLTSLPNDSGQYPYRLGLNVGPPADIDNQYEFRGQGYGFMGMQKLFSDGDEINNYSFQSGGGMDDTIRVKLPKTAKINSAELQLTGDFFQVVDKTVINNTQTSVSQILSVDMDGDNDTDVLVAGSNRVVWYENFLGNGKTWYEHTINSSQTNVLYVHALDMDNDTDIDVIAGSRSAGWPGAGPLMYYRNMDSNGTKWEDHLVNATIPGICGIRIADMDNDGDGDIVVSNRNWTAGATGVYWYNNTNINGTNWTGHELGKNTPRLSTLEVFDVDDDGDNDTVVADWSWPRSLYWFENVDGDAKTWSKSLLGQLSGNGQTTNLAIGDIDDDGDTDIAVSMTTGVYWHRQPANPKNTWTGYTIDTFTAWSGSDVAIADIGNPGAEPDGDLDIVAVSYNNGDVIWYENDGNPAKNNWDSHNINLNHQAANTVVVADIDNKSYIDIVVGSGNNPTDDVVWYKTNGSFPSNVALDIGKDTVNDWTYNTGWFNSTVTIDNLGSTFQSLVSTKPSTTDNFGNEMVTLEFQLNTGSGGIVRFHDLKIEYDYTVKVAGSQDRSLAVEINEHVSISGAGNDSIPIRVSSTSGGKLKVSNITIVYNDFPKALPIEEYFLDEDTINSSLIDLSKYFVDDYFASTELTYEVVDYTQQAFLEIKIKNGHWLSVDASQDKGLNWNGNSTVTVKAVDDIFLETNSAPFVVTVRPVNDEPTVGSKKIPDISINEGGEGLKLNLAVSDFFVDIDSTEFYYDSLIDPLGEQDGEQLNATADSQNKTITVSAYGDWFTTPGNSVRLRIYCDDDPDEINQSAAYQDIFVTVNNLDDDPPRWLPIPDIVMNEDEPLGDAFNLYSYITDIDNPKEDLKFSIIHVSDNHVYVNIDTQGNIDISSEKDFFGSAVVDLRATDGTNVGTTIFNITIKNVNDGPTAEMTIPQNNAKVYTDSIVLKWKGTDVDPGDAANLTYTIYIDKEGSFEYPYKIDYEGTSVEFKPLTDKTTYYWKVIPHDGREEGICISQPSPYQFSVEIADKPHSVLELPGDDSITNKEFIVLSWTGSGEAGATVYYSVYVSTSPLSAPYPESALMVNGTTETEFLVQNITEGSTYYWTVIPFTGKAVGVCDSGVWKFSYDPSINPYSFTLEAPEIIEVEEGKPYQHIIKIINTGSNSDILIPTIVTGELKSLVELENADIRTTLDQNGTILLALNISADLIQKGSYDIEITIDSIRPDSESQSATITINIYEPKSETQDLFSQPAFTIIPIIIIIIILIVVFLVWRNRRIAEEKKRVEAEMLKPLAGSPTTIDAAQVTYISGAGAPSTVGPSTPEVAQLPQVTLPYDAAAQAGYAPSYGAQPPGAPAQQYPYGGAAQQPLPQLPPAQDTGVGAPPTQAPPTQAYPPYQQPPQTQPEPYPGSAGYQAPGEPYPPQPQEPAPAPPQPQYPPQPPQEPVRERVTRPGTPPVQVPYEPKARAQPQTPPGGIGTTESRPPTPGVDLPFKKPIQDQETAAAPEQVQTPEQLTETLKNKFIQGGMSEDTYIALKKELKEKIDSSAAGTPTEPVDDIVSRFIQGQITEDEYKLQRKL
jgi:uncharacterized membrane protein